MYRLVRTSLALCAIVLLAGSAACAGEKLPEPQRLGGVRKNYDLTPLHRVSITFSADGKKLAWMHHQPEGSSPEEGGLALIVWDFDKGYQIQELKSEKPRTYARSPARFTPNGRMIVIGCFQAIPTFTAKGEPQTEYRNNVQVWLLTSGKELPIVPREAGLNQDSWEAVMVNPDGRAITAANPRGGRTWKIPDGEVALKFEYPEANHLVLSADCNFVAGTTGDKNVTIFKTADGKELSKLPGTGRALEFSPDGKRLATWHEDKVCLWEVEGSKELWSQPCSLSREDRWGPQFAFTPDGQRAAWNDGKSITLVDAVSSKVMLTLSTEKGPIAFAPDGQRLALACPDGTALVWNLGPGKK